jgi:hypothetical protein
MLAYVFWHWHSRLVDAHIYQEALINFHRTLSAHKPGGFHYSRVLLVEQASWLGRDEPTYEDWNIVENSAALDPLNEGAVSGACQEPHNQVARWAEGGTGGLYRLRFGDGRLQEVCFALRFDKPAGMTYAALYDLLRPLEEQSAGDLWVRQMTLGPGPEFCFHSSQELAFPEILHALKIPVKQIWFNV